MIKNKIDTVIFDIGNVLMEFDYMPFIKKLLGDDETVEHVNNAIWRTRYWDELDRGEDTEKMLAKMIAAEPGYEEQIRITFDRVCECMKGCDYAIPWIRSLQKQGFRVLYLSNYSPYAMAAKPDVLNFVPFMDGGIFSCDVRINKPDPEIFRLLIAKYDLTPGNCIFIDDNLDNIETAGKLGFNAIQFRGYEQASREVELLLP